MVDFPSVGHFSYEVISGCHIGDEVSCHIHI